MPASHFAPERFPVTVDVVALTVRNGELNVLLITRLIEPFKGKLALPGGFVLAGEDLLEAAGRELAEETGVEHLPGHLEQLGSYGPKGRDPRGDVLTVAHLLLAPDFPVLSAGSDAEQAAWYPVREVLDGTLELAFDHAHILGDALERAKSKLEYSPLGAMPSVATNSLSPSFAPSTRLCGGHAWTRGTSTEKRPGRPVSLRTPGE